MTDSNPSRPRSRSRSSSSTGSSTVAAAERYLTRAAGRRVRRARPAQSLPHRGPLRRHGRRRAGHGRLSRSGCASRVAARSSRSSRSARTEGPAAPSGARSSRARPIGPPDRPTGRRRRRARSSSSSPATRRSSSWSRSASSAASADPRRRDTRVELSLDEVDVVAGGRGSSGSSSSRRSCVEGAEARLDELADDLRRGPGADADDREQARRRAGDRRGPRARHGTASDGAEAAAEAATRPTATVGAGDAADPTTPTAGERRRDDDRAGPMPSRRPARADADDDARPRVGRRRGALEAEAMAADARRRRALPDLADFIAAGLPTTADVVLSPEPPDDSRLVVGKTPGRHRRRPHRRGRPQGPALPPRPDARPRGRHARRASMPRSSTRCASRPAGSGPRGASSGRRSGPAGRSATGTACARSPSRLGRRPRPRRPARGGRRLPGRPAGRRAARARAAAARLARPPRRRPRPAPPRAGLRTATSAGSTTTATSSGPRARRSSRSARPSRTASATPPPSRIWAAYEQVRAYEPVLRWADVETLHELRIAGKWLRYTLEFVREALGRSRAAHRAGHRAPGPPRPDERRRRRRVDGPDLPGRARRRAVGRSRARRSAATSSAARRRSPACGGRSRVPWRGVAGVSFRRGLGRVVAGLCTDAVRPQSRQPWASSGSRSRQAPPTWSTTRIAPSRMPASDTRIRVDPVASQQRVHDRGAGRQDARPDRLDQVALDGFRGRSRWPGSPAPRRSAPGSAPGRCGPPAPP